MDLAEFLAARLDEDEAAARAAVGFDYGVKDWADDGDPVNVHIARHDPARVLREVEADRTFLRLYEQNKGAEYPDFDGGYQSALEDVLKIRAVRFGDHPDYREK